MSIEYKYTGLIKHGGIMEIYYFEPSNKVWYINVDSYDGRIFHITGSIQNGTSDRNYGFMVKLDGSLELIGRYKYCEPDLPIPKYVQDKIKEISNNMKMDREYYKKLA